MNPPRPHAALDNNAQFLHPPVPQRTSFALSPSRGPREGRVKGGTNLAERKRMRSSPRAMVVVSILSAELFSTVAAEALPARQFNVTVQVGPVTQSASDTRSVVFDEAALRNTRTFDVQDGREHIVRGISLRELLVQARAPKAVDTAVFVYSDGMQIPVRLADKVEADAVFIALEHGDARERFTTTYPLQNKGELACPKVVYGRRVNDYTIWLYPTQLESIKLVSWKLHEAALAQATRGLPDRSGWPLYLRHCQPCHGIGRQGAARGPDFLSDLDAYRRVPPLAVTDVSQQPSLHEKVKGYTDGTMPVLSHVSSSEIATLWRWLHAIHRTATK